jgi:hypothetical protein
VSWVDDPASTVDADISGVRRDRYAQRVRWPGTNGAFDRGIAHRPRRRFATPLAQVRGRQAIAYGRKRWIALTRFVDDGRLEIDNNIAERAMRSIAIGRKNWLSTPKPTPSAASTTSVATATP